MTATLPFGKSGLQVPQPGFGAMGISFGLGNSMSLEEAEPVLLKAIELGEVLPTAASAMHDAYTVLQGAHSGIQLSYMLLE